MRFHTRLLPVAALLALLSMPTAWSAEPASPDVTDTRPDRGRTLLKLLDNEFVTLDLKGLDGARGGFGLDYKFNFARTLRQDGESGQRWEFNLKGNGFVTTDAARNQVDSLITEANLTLFPLWRILPPLPPDGEGKTSIDLSKASDDDLINRSRQLAARLSPPLSIYADAHFKDETTQDGSTRDLAAGANIALTTSYLDGLLDFPFRWLRWRDSAHPDAANGPRQLDIAVGYDYVTARHREQAGPEDDLDRLGFHAEWETGIFLHDRVFFVFDGYEVLNGRGNEQGFHSFFVAKYEHLLVSTPNTRTTFSIKYTAGSLPPEFKQGQVLGGGISVEF